MSVNKSSFPFLDSVILTPRIRDSCSPITKLSRLTHIPWVDTLSTGKLYIQAGCRMVQKFGPKGNKN